MLAGQQQAAVTVAVEGLMDAKAAPESDAFLTFDPKVCMPHSWCHLTLAAASRCRCLAFADVVGMYTASRRSISAVMTLLCDALW